MQFPADAADCIHADLRGTESAKISVSFNQRRSAGKTQIINRIPNCTVGTNLAENLLSSAGRIVAFVKIPLL
jgi:hypothetical protein